MKHTLLSLCMLASSLSLFAQKSELGIGGGITYHTGASGSIHYKGDQSAIAGTFNLTYLRNINSANTESKVTAQLGFNIHVLKLANEATDTFIYFGQTIGNDGRDFLYAKTAIAICPAVNIKYALTQRTYIYGGASIGVVYGMTPSNKGFFDYEGKDYTYTAPSGGTGVCAGIQAGVTQRLTQRLALNLEVGARYYNLHYSVDDTAYPGGFEFGYNTIAIPATLGIRYRMGWAKEYDKEGRMRPVPDLDED